MPQRYYLVEVEKFDVLVGQVDRLEKEVRDLALNSEIDFPPPAREFQPRFTIADRDAKIKGLEAELEAQRAHYQGELEKARKAVDSLSSEYFIEHSRRIKVENVLERAREG